MANGDGGSRQKIMLGAAVVLLIVAGIFVLRSLGPDRGVASSETRDFMCAECGKPFAYTLKIGDMEPFKCPSCGAMAGYRAEKCYWTQGEDGEWKAKLEPTYVILKKRMDRTCTEKTYCPDCGREVIGHNPPPPQELMDQAKAEAGS